jgi:hypothetical protein
MSSSDDEEEKRLVICLKSISKNLRVKIAALAQKHRVLYDKL